MRYKCPKCEYQLETMSINPRDLSIGDAKYKPKQTCPNDGQELVPVIGQADD